MKKLAVLAGTVALGASTAFPALAATRNSGAGSGVACNDGTITWSPTTLWPPNHKLVTVTINYTDTDGDANETIMDQVTNVTETDGSTTSNALVGDDLKGSGAPGSVQGPDAVPGAAGSSTDPGTATTTVQLRAERSGTDGHGSGRIYTISVQCMDSATADPNDTGELGGQTNTATITVTVPHDQG